MEPIYYDQPGMKGKVQPRIAQAIEKLGVHPHSVVIMTHCALLDLAPERLTGWHVAVDEVPEGGVVSNRFAAGASWHNLDRLYRLEPVSGGWWRVLPRGEADLPTPGEVIHDSAEALREFHRRALNPARTVLIDIGNWQDARGTRKRVRWHSCWTPHGLLRHAASVTFAGANVLDSLVCRAAERVGADEIEFRPVPIASGRTAAPRVLIHYFTRHEGTTLWWDTQEGSRCLFKIGSHLSGIGFDGFWSGNHTVIPYLRHRFPGQEVAPRLSGTNGLREHRRCAYIYSNKPQAADGPLLEALGFDRDDIRRTREDEDVIQFVCRGAIRDGSFGGTYEVFLYSEQQAQRLHAYLVKSGITDDVELVPVVEAGLMDEERPSLPERLRREPDTITISERLALRREKARLRAQKNRDRKRAEAERNGTAKKRGRPKVKEAARVRLLPTLAEGADSAEIRVPEGSIKTGSGAAPTSLPGSAFQPLVEEPCLGDHVVARSSRGSADIAHPIAPGL